MPCYFTLVLGINIINFHYIKLKHKHIFNIEQYFVSLSFLQNTEELAKVHSERC